MKPALDLSLYLVTDARQCAGRGLIETVRAAVVGGVTLVQVRDKEASDAEVLETARALKAMLRPLGVPLIVNDRVQVAQAAGADGAHVGQSDAAAAEARAVLGPSALIGLSVDRMEQTARVDPAVVDYVGCGPVRPTTTKPDHKTPIGVAGAAALAAAAGVPGVGIGGVGLGVAGLLIASGLDGVAVVSAICAAEDPEAAARALATEIAAARREKAGA